MYILRLFNLLLVSCVLLARYLGDGTGYSSDEGESGSDANESDGDNSVVERYRRRVDSVDEVDGGTFQDMAGDMY